MALIFVWDGDYVGCLKVVFFGWPFQALRATFGPACDSRKDLLASNGTEAQDAALKACKLTATAPLSEAPTETPQKAAPLEESTARSRGGPVTQMANHLALEEVKIALKQLARKQFEPVDELREVKMNLLWIMFFAPVMPLGIFTTLIARFIEVKTDLYKLLYIRRRAFPDDDDSEKVLEQTTQNAFVRAAVCAGAGWSAGLTLITYNDELWTWGHWRYVVLVALAAWMVMSAVVAFLHRWKDLRFMNAVLLVLAVTTLFCLALFFVMVE